MLKGAANSEKEFLPRGSQRTEKMGKNLNLFANSKRDLSADSTLCRPPVPR